MNIAIFNSCGGGELPSFINLDSEKHWRISLAEQLMLIKESEDIKSDFEKLENNELEYARYKNLVYIKDSAYKYIYTLKIVDVDISKKWRIDNHNGKESIEYIKELKLIDKELNLYE